MKSISLIKISFAANIIGLFLIIISSQSASSIERDKYLYFNDIDGLPRNIITSIEQDKYGYTWIGTGNGISRFDGSQFKNYDLLKGQNIWQLLIDSENDLWVAGEHGLYFYNRLIDHFEIKYEGFILAVHQYLDTIYFSDVNSIMKIDPKGITEIISDDNILDFHITTKGIWYANDVDGVKLLSYRGASTSKDDLLKGKSVLVIREINGNIFFGCSNGELFTFNPDGTASKVAIENHHAIKEIIKVNNEIWLATDGNGVIILDEKLNYKKSLNRGDQKNPMFKSNSIYDIYLGNDNEVWVATFGAGLLCLKDEVSPFKSIIPEPGNQNSLVAEEGVSAMEKDGKIYFGTNYGLSVLEENTGEFTHLTMSQLKSDLRGVKVLAINSDEQNNLWIGTYDGLLGKYTSDLKFIRSYQPCGDKATDMQRIIFAHNCAGNNLLIGTHYLERSLLKYNTETETSIPIKMSNGEFESANFQLMSLRENRDKEILALIRADGLYTVNLDKNILENDLPEVNNRITFRLNDFYHDANGNYWLATQTKGLVKISEDGLEFDKWTTDQGLPTNTLLRIESTDDKYLWISTISGLCRFEMETGSVLIFNYEHGLPINEFTSRASTVTDDGRIIFGSIAGFTIIDPNKVEPGISETEVIISDVTFHNQSIKHLTDKSYLTRPIEETKEIELPYKRNSFTIHFFSKDKDLPKNNNYSYRLIGLEDNWINLGETKHTTYTNLSPGEYTFEVKSTNKNNIWNNNPTQLAIRINSPWYLSWYAFVFYVVFVIAVITVIIYVYSYRLKMRKEVEFSEFKLKAEHELTEKKLAFFTNVSHDFKTPLTLINAPLKDLLGSVNLNDEQRNKLNVIYKNSGRLYKLISDLLDFRKLTQKNLPLMIRETNIEELVENTCAAFHQEYISKDINLICNIENLEEVYVDPRKIEKILWNLLSNAIKFTPADGEIYVNVDQIKENEKQHLQILIKDTGIGISEKDKDKIFDRFYQARNGNNNTYEGTGIGLSIVKDLVEIHHGKIEFSSTPGLGTTFILTFPSKKEYYSDPEIDKSVRKNEVPFAKEHLLELSQEEQKKHTQYNLPKILLVEDNVELLDYLGGHFEKEFKVYKASDGKKGLQLAKEKNPDVIITDVLMPNMNGYEFCKMVKQQFETSHIPVVMLTANSTIEQQIEGLEKGADAYIAKPFDIELLDSTVKSVLKNREKIRERFAGGSKDEEFYNKFTKKDIEFINQLKLFIDNNIENYELNVQFISDHFAMSKSHLTRKTKALTGLTPNNLIKSVRLKKAYDLIKNEGLRVAEVAELTGFIDPNYFTVCFSKEFGKNPSKI